MEKWVLVVRANCADQSFEGNKEFNDWYDDIHVPDIMTIPGFKTAARYINPDISTLETGKYLAIYEIETELFVIEKGKDYIKENPNDAELIATYAEKPIKNYPKLLPILEELKKRQKKEFDKRGIPWKPEYDKYKDEIIDTSNLNNINIDKENGI